MSEIGVFVVVSIVLALAMVVGALAWLLWSDCGRPARRRRTRS
jgi:hypothetical protein